MNIKKAIILFIPVLAIILGGVLIDNQSFETSFASNPSVLIHAESGVRSGAVGVKSDTSVGGGQYIEFGATGIQPTQPPATPGPTTPPVGGSPVVMAAGDIVCGTGSSGAACKQRETSDLVVNANPAAVLLLGDVQYEQGALSDFQTYYHPSWGRFKDKTYPSVGNHEYLTSNASGYFDYFNGVGVQSGRAGDRSKGYYAFNVGSWRLYALNSNCSKAGGCGAGSPQESWLRADLAANPKRCTLAYFHHPMWTSGSRSSTDVKPLYQAMYDLGGELMLAGHEHNYERFAPMDPNGNLDNARGLREFVSGGGGRNFTQFVTTARNSERKDDRTFGVLKLTLHPDRYDWQFVPIAGSTSGFTDSGTTVCH